MFFSSFLGRPSWEGIPLHRFWIRAVHHGLSDLCASSPRVPLDDFRFRKGALFAYDMADSWRNEIRVEAQFATNIPNSRVIIPNDGKRQRNDEPAFAPLQPRFA